MSESMAERAARCQNEQDDPFFKVRESLRTQLEQAQARLLEKKGYLDAIARALHPHKPKDGGWTYVPDQLAGMVEQIQGEVAALHRRLTIMCRDWRDIVGTPEENSTPNDVLELAELALASTQATAQAHDDRVRAEVSEKARLTHIRLAQKEIDKSFAEGYAKGQENMRERSFRVDFCAPLDIEDTYDEWCAALPILPETRGEEEKS